MNRKTEYNHTLGRLEVLLRRTPMTARAIAKTMGCCRPVAYQRLAALRARGLPICEVQIRESATGPRSTAYSIR